jgi:hypothetical protein
MSRIVPICLTSYFTLLGKPQSCSEMVVSIKVISASVGNWTRCSRDFTDCDLLLILPEVNYRLQFSIEGASLSYLVFEDTNLELRWISEK